MKIKGIVPDGVVLTRDEHGIPHIQADDLAGAYWGMGYAHARDRAMQMGLMRLLGQGRVAECLDGSDESVEVDRFFRRMNWYGNTASQIDLLTPETRSLVDAYCAGANVRFGEARPWEFRALGYRPEPWTVEDVLLISRMTGYLTLATSQAEIERLFVEMVQAGVDDERLDALFPGCIQNLDRDLLEQVKLGERIVPDSVKWTVGGPRMMASNNWVVSAERSATGHALLANDLHLEVNRLPNVWAEQVFELPNDTVFTATMPGLAGPLVGRKNDLSWGATYAFMDAVDSWIEECHDGAFRREDRFEPFTERREQILVKKSEPVDVVFYENMHGTLDGDPFEAGLYLATRWAPADSGAEALNAVSDIWAARNVEEAQPIFGRLETAWNWVFADSSGRIGYQMSGQLPIRDEAATGFVPMPGWDPKWDWRGFVEPSDLPGVIDPSEGIIVTANNDLNHLGAADPINMPMGDYRARRITGLLSEEPVDLDSFRRIHQDTYSIQAEEMMAILAPLLPASRIGHRLGGWDFRYELDSRGAVLFEAFYRELLVEMFAPDGVGQPVVDHLIDATGVFIDFYQNFDRILLSSESPWLGERDLDSVYRNAFDRVDTGEDRRWGDVNRVTLTHILLGGKLPGWAGFDVGPIEVKGGRATPHQGQIYESAGRTTSFAPSLRLMVDMGEDGLLTALAGGPSDRRFSKWYTSDLERWQRGEYKDLRRLNESEK
ncbi:MAG: penicillin acylase family protein [Actinomycetota bacterium]|nr:penicillin acylase family protein [Actinomycetota bacterium]